MKVITTSYTCNLCHRERLGTLDVLALWEGANGSLKPTVEMDIERAAGHLCRLCAENIALFVALESSGAKRAAEASS